MSDRPPSSTGDGHPRSRAVLTPAGRFDSLTIAAEHYGITRQAAHYRAKNGRLGWQWDARPNDGIVRIRNPDGGSIPLKP